VSSGAPYQNEQRRIAATPEEEFRVRAHLGLGLWVRNTRPATTSSTPETWNCAPPLPGRAPRPGLGGNPRCALGAVAGRPAGVTRSEEAEESVLEGAPGPGLRTCWRALARRRKLQSCLRSPSGARSLCRPIPSLTEPPRVYKDLFRTVRGRYAR